MALAEAQKLRRVLLHCFPSFCQISVSTTSFEKPPTHAPAGAAKVICISNNLSYILLLQMSDLYVSNIFSPLSYFDDDIYLGEHCNGRSSSTTRNFEASGDPWFFVVVNDICFVYRFYLAYRPFLFLTFSVCKYSIFLTI